MECPDPSTIGVKRCDRLARRRIREILDRRDDVAHRLLQIRLEVAVADDTLVGIEVYQDDRPVAKETYLGNNRAFQWHDHGPCADIPQGQATWRHERNPFRPSQPRRSQTAATLAQISSGIVCCQAPAATRDPPAARRPDCRALIRWRLRENSLIIFSATRSGVLQSQPACNEPLSG